MPIFFEHICIYCGSSTKVSDNYKLEAYKVGQYLAQHQSTLVYGGGNVGLMKEVADGARSLEGIVWGVIPHHLQKLELAHPNLSRLFVTQSMHERKAMMANLSDAFIALPGGYGTIEELMEVITWSQLNYHSKPVGILNIDGYFDGLLQWIQRACDDAFIAPAHRNLLVVEDNIEELILGMSKVKFVNIANHI